MRAPRWRGFAGELGRGGVKRLGLNLHKTQEQRLPRAAYNSLDQNFATRAAAAARRSSVARIYDVTTKVKLNPPMRALLSPDWYFFALYPGISAPFAKGRLSAKSISRSKRSPRNVLAIPWRRAAWPSGPLAQESEK